MANKTLIQWYQELEPDIRKKAVANVIKQHSVKFLAKEEEPSLSKHLPWFSL